MPIVSQTQFCCATSIAARRASLKTALILMAFGLAAELLPGLTHAAALSKGQRDAMTPDDVIAMLKHGNERFRAGRLQTHDYLAQKRASASGQYPAAVILSCMDSRAPAEIIFDAGIGDTFDTRVAGNIVNDDLLGSLEYACAAAGSKVVLVMGHTSCGAIEGAIDGANLGNLTGLLNKIKPALDATKFDGERNSKNDAFVDAVAATNVRQTIDQIRGRSDVLANLEKNGKIKIVGSMYHLVGGEVEFYS
ncbi:carbonic anhydrase [Burkholderia sp. MSMB1078WGS]|uniref:carbonic anhydrase family protein n=1 Tax=Burkholderia sp. MSMB1078WGS TaxID=1637900 RepID=UPI00075203BB|nr:carbonic anhydrase family protein [Burkholderia sp. MSMB1078WGS]KVT08785.1 carbonic anhydrase [Burkholderia sp. MSMB1078WGS]